LIRRESEGDDCSSALGRKKKDSSTPPVSREKGENPRKRADFGKRESVPKGVRAVRSKERNWG